MKFGRCRERRSKSPTPRKGHRSAKLPSQEPLQTSALRSTSSTPGETLRRLPPPPTMAHPVLPVRWEQPVLPVPWASGGFPRPAGMDGVLLRPLSRDQTSPAGRVPPAGTLAGDQEPPRCWQSGCRSRRAPALPPPSLKNFAHGWARLPPSLPVEEAGDGDRNGAEPVAGRHHLGPACWDPSIAYCLFHVLPGLPKAFLHSLKTISPINARHGNGLTASFSS